MLLAGSPGTQTVVIDEIQRAPELLSVVHAVLEEPSPPRFVLTGSSARKLRRGDVNLPGGRALHRTLHPFMAAELPDFDLERALRIGLVPMVVDGSGPREHPRCLRQPLHRSGGTGGGPYRGRERLKIDGIWCLPVDEFLKRIVPGRGLLDGV